MDLTCNGKTLQLMDFYNFPYYWEDGSGEGRIDISIYEINDLLYTPENPKNIFNYHKLLTELYPFLLQHILKDKYQNKSFIFTFYFYNDDENEPRQVSYKYFLSHINYDMLFKIKLSGDPYYMHSLIQMLSSEIFKFEDDHIMVDNLDYKKLVILSQEEVLKSFVQAPQPNNINKNRHKTFQSDECAICMINIPNVLFCERGHLCVCSSCFQNIEQIEKTPCVLCKKENKTIRILS